MHNFFHEIYTFQIYPNIKGSNLQKKNINNNHSEIRMKYKIFFYVNK